MSHTATITWAKKPDETFTDNRYHRSHTWKFDGGLEVPASAAPKVVPVPMSDPTAVDPEEAFVASLSSCHMLWFLAIAAKQGFVVEKYIDQAEGILGAVESATDKSRQMMTQVSLRPIVTFGGDRKPSETEHDAMHHQAHEKCFIANSVKTVVICAARCNNTVATLARCQAIHDSFTARLAGNRILARSNHVFTYIKDAYNGTFTRRRCGCGGVEMGRRNPWHDHRLSACVLVAWGDLLINRFCISMAAPL